MTDITTWGNICRICSSPADYEVFAKIPTYLHANSNEFLNWQKPINVLLEETTGLKVTSDDGLPHFVCALCISYLKHAVYFRDQVINNALGLKAVQALHALPMDKSGERRKTEKESVLVTANDLNYSEERKTDTNLLYSNENRDKVRKQLLNNFGCQPTQQVAEGGAEIENIRYLNLLFDKQNNKATKRDKVSRNLSEAYEPATGSDPFVEDFQTASSDENEATEQKLNYFSYREKNFEEDDIMDLDELKDIITVNIPESCKERKCRACFRRFMFEESYTEHMETCIEYKFLTTIEEINRLLDIRRAKAISPHEFIRRMIFCLRKTCEWLKATCGEMLLPELLQNNEVGGSKKRTESEGKSSAADASSGASGVKSGEVRPHKLTISERLAKAGEQQGKTKMADFTSNSNTTKNDLLNDPNMFKNPAAKPASRTVTPISLENNILYEIERSESRSKQETMSRKASTPVQEQERITFLQKLQNAASTTFSTPSTKARNLPHTANASPMITVRKDLLPTTPKNPKLLFSARCNLCMTTFATVAELEEHNAVYHNAQQLREKKQKAELDERQKIIALFEESSDD